MSRGFYPGPLFAIAELHFICEHIHVRVERHNSPFTNATWNGAVLRLPIAHGEGCYFAEDAVLHHLEREGRVLFRYCDARGRTAEAANPNGSKDNIAGICNEARNVCGLMPHPERACDPLLGSTDGLLIFKACLSGPARRLRQVA